LAITDMSGGVAPGNLNRCRGKWSAGRPVRSIGFLIVDAS